jgi:hypothetical protein
MNLQENTIERPASPAGSVKSTRSIANVASMVLQMKNASKCLKLFRSAKQSLQDVSKDMSSAQTISSSYQLAFAGNDFLLREDMRHARLELEYQKCEKILTDGDIHSFIVVFGSARIREEHISRRMMADAELDLKQGKITQSEYDIKANLARFSRYYDIAEELGGIVGSCKELGVICTGGGPGLTFLIKESWRQLVEGLKLLMLKQSD